MDYEFTLTLRPVLYKFKPQEQFDKTYPLLCSALAEESASAVAELTNEMNVHYHCIVTLKNFEHKASFLNKFRKYNTIFGRKSISQLVDYYKYTDYITKDLEVTRKVIKDPIVRNQHDIFHMKDKLLKEN